MRFKLLAIIASIMLLLNNFLIVQGEENDDDNESAEEPIELTPDEIQDFVNEWTQIILTPDSFNITNLPPEEKYVNYTGEEKRFLVETLLDELENESVEVYNDLHPENATTLEIKENREKMVGFLGSLIFDREKLIEQLQNISNPMENETILDDSQFFNENQSTIEWGNSDTIEENLEEIRLAGEENDIDTKISENRTYVSPLNDTLVSTTTPPFQIENTLDNMTRDFSDNASEYLFHPIIYSSEQSLFQSENITFTNDLHTILGKFLSILDSLTYAVYIKSGNTTTYTKSLTFCRSHQLNVDKKILTGPLGKDIAIRAGIRIVPSLRERTINFGVELKIRRLCTLLNRTLPLEIITFFRIPDSEGGENDHILLLGYSSEKSAFNTEDKNAPKCTTFSFFVNTKGELIVDFSTWKAHEGLKLIAGIGNRNIDERGNVGIVNFTKIENLFSLAPRQFRITLNTQKFQFEPLTLTLTTCNPLTIVSRIAGEKFGIQMLIDKIEETTMNFSWKNGTFTYHTKKPINGTFVQIAGDFKNATLIGTSHTRCAKSTILPCEPLGRPGYLTIFGRTIMPLPGNATIIIGESYAQNIADYFSAIDKGRNYEEFYPMGVEKIPEDYINTINLGASTPGYYLGVGIVDMPGNISLRWRDLEYISFTMDESLGPFDVTFINLSRDIITWPNIGNLVGAQLDTGAKIRFWAVPLKNVTIDVANKKIHVHLFQELSMFFYVGASLEGEPLNISGLIGQIPAGDIDIRLNWSSIHYSADGNIDVMAAVLTYKGLLSAIGLVSLPREIAVSWNFNKANISMEMNEQIGSIVFSSSFNYYWLKIGNFPPPKWATKDTLVYFSVNGIPGFYVNWSRGLEYKGQVEHTGASIFFKLIKEDTTGHYDYFPLTGYGLTLYTTLFTPTDPLGIKSMGIFGNFNIPSYIKYYRTTNDKTHIKIESDPRMTDFMIKGRIEFVSPNTIGSLYTLFKKFPGQIDIEYDKDLNNFTYTADRSAFVNMYMEYGKPSVIATTPNPPLDKVGFRINDKKGDIAVKARLQITIPESFFIYYNLDKKNHIIGVSFTASSHVINGVDINAYVDAYIGGVYIRDTTFRVVLSNIPTQIFFGAMYHIRGGDMWASMSYVANQGINSIFAGIQRPDTHGVKDWAAYAEILDIPTEFSITIGKEEDFPILSYTASSSTLDIMTMLDGTRFEDLVEIPYINQLPYLEVNIIDIPAHGLTINYNKASYRCTIRTNNYPTEKVGEFTIKFNIVVGGSYNKYNEDRWGWSWIGIYFEYWVDLYLQVGVREYILEVKDWNQLIIDLEAPEIIVTIDGLPSACFYMKWSIKIDFSIDAGLSVGLYLDIGWAHIHKKLEFLGIYADISLSGYVSLHNYVWDDYWPKHKITLINLLVIKAGVEYRWPNIHHTINTITLTGPNTYHWMISPCDLGDLIKLYIVVKYWGKFWSGIGWWYDWWP